MISRSCRSIGGKDGSLGKQLAKTNIYIFKLVKRSLKRYLNIELEREVVYISSWIGQLFRKCKEIFFGRCIYIHGPIFIYTRSFLHGFRLQSSSLSLYPPPPQETRVGQNKHPRNFQLADVGKRRKERLEILYLRINRYRPPLVSSSKRLFVVK